MLIPTTKNTRTVTDLREDTINILSNVRKLGYLYIFNRSEPKAVILSLDEFTKLHMMLEDYANEKDAKKLAAEPRGKGISHSEIVKKYSK